MTESNGKRPMAIVSACMNANGCPAFALNQVEVTQEDIDNGIHYYLVEAQLLEAGYEEPFVYFDETEAPPFLHAAVRQFLSVSLVVAEPITPVLSEER
jgi:hypothetical protein